MKKPKEIRPPLRKRSNFTGTLNSPIDEKAFWNEVLEIYGLSATDKNANTHLLNVRIAKIQLLLAHYGIASSDNDRWVKLSYALARDFVPGFQISKGRGRPPKPWWIDEFIFDEIRAIEKVRGKGVSDAARIARKRNPSLRGYSLEGLEARYYEKLREAERVGPATEEALTVKRSSIHIEY